MVSDSNFIRRKVFERDKGICAICGCDTTHIKKRIEHARVVLSGRHIWADTYSIRYRDGGKWNGRFLRERYERSMELLRRHSQILRRAAQNRLNQYAAMGFTMKRESFWDADHIIPVAEGGGECDLSNLRTLCHCCHKQVTKELAARLAERRKKNQTQQTP